MGQKLIIGVQPYDAAMPTEFEEKVYALCKKIPKGRVTTYAKIAHALGTSAYRAVGQALKKNPYAPEVPCHRVVASDGTIGGFNGHTNGPDIQRKIALLKKEGVPIIGNKVLNFRSKIYCPR